MYNAFAMQAFGETYADTWFPPLPEQEPWELDYGYELWYEQSLWNEAIHSVWDSEEQEFGAELDVLPRANNTWVWGA